MTSQSQLIVTGVARPRETVRHLARRGLRFARHKRLGTVGLVILLVFIGGAAVAPWLAPYGYDTVDFQARLAPPSLDHILGTDQLGRDLFTRILFGTRVSLGVSLAAVLVGKLLGVTIAVVSAYYGKWLDISVQRVIDIWLSLPNLVILLTLLGLIGPSIPSMILVVGLSNVPFSVRLFRSVALQLMVEPYVEAARALGASDIRIMTRYLVPNLLPIVIYSATVMLGSTILVIASLGFLGFGLPPPHPDLGSMLSGAGLDYMRRAPWMAVWAGMAITLIVFGFNVFGDALRDVLDPRLRGTS